MFMCEEMMSIILHLSPHGLLSLPLEDFYLSSSIHLDDGPAEFLAFNSVSTNLSALAVGSGHPQTWRVDATGQ